MRVPCSHSPLLKEPLDPPDLTVWRRLAPLCRTRNETPFLASLCDLPLVQGHLYAVCVGCDLCAAFTNVSIDAVGYEQQDGRNDPPKDNAGDGIDGAAKIRSLAGRGLNRSR